MAVKSAGTLLYKRENGVLKVLLVHPGGPFWARKDAGAWSIPKGEYVDGEDPEAAARREFAEELGVALDRRSAAPRRSRPAEPQARHRLRGRGRSRRRGDPQQHLRDRMAAEERAPTVLSRGRPRGLVHPRRGAREALAGPADVSGSPLREAPNLLMLRCEERSSEPRSTHRRWAPRRHRASFEAQPFGFAPQDEESGVRSSHYAFAACSWVT